MEWKMGGERFIELTDLKGYLIAVNICSIASFGTGPDKHIWISLKGDLETFSVLETYEAIKQAIKGCGG
jgi:hypothetical protein